MPEPEIEPEPVEPEPVEPEPIEPEPEPEPLSDTNITINTTAIAGLAENVKGEELEQA